MTELIEVLFCIWVRVDPKNHVLGGGPYPQGEWEFRGNTFCDGIKIFFDHLL